MLFLTRIHGELWQTSAVILLLETGSYKNDNKLGQVWAAACNYTL